MIVERPWRPWSGRVTLTMRDAATGEVVDVVEGRNAYTTAAAWAYASVLAGSGPALALTHVDLASGGGMLCSCDSVTGWTGAPTLDTAVFKEGTGSLTGSASASGTSTYYHATSYGGTYVLGSTGSIALWLRVDTRSALDLANSRIRIYGPTASDYRHITLAGAEAATGLTLADGTWTRFVIPASAAGWSVGAGTPSWATVTGMGMVVKAAGAPTATLRWDEVLAKPIISTAAADMAGWTAMPGSRGTKTIDTKSAASGVVTVEAAWSESQMVGSFDFVGLYASGALVACAPLVGYKSASVVTSLVWTGTLTGG